MDAPGPAAVARARALLPALAARAAAVEEAREVPAETIADLRAAGLFRLLQPRRFGGRAAPFPLFSAVVETLAEACAASAWVTAVLGEHAWVIACFPEAAQHDVWGADPEALACSSLVPRAVAEPVPGGWRLSGRWPFSSGSAHARWAIVGATCTDGDAGKAARPHTRYLLVPMDQVERLDDWHVLGLRGTGSRSLLLREVIVPAHRTLALDDLLAGTPPGRAVHPDYALLRAPRYLFVPYSLPSVAIGLGAHALACATDLLRGKPGRGGAPLAASDWVQVELGQAAAEIDTARLILHAGRREAQAALDAGGAIDPLVTETHRRDMAFAVALVRGGIERLCALAGSAVVYDASPLQRLLRDALTLATHSVVAQREAMGAAGRRRLGIAATDVPSDLPRGGRDG